MRVTYTQYKGDDTDLKSGVCFGGHVGYGGVSSECRGASARSGWSAYLAENALTFEARGKGVGEGGGGVPGYKPLGPTHWMGATTVSSKAQ